jgi:lipoate-protein ligase A
MVSHGTLLFDSDLSHVVEALKVKMSSITSKGIKSIRSQVVNIKEFIHEPLDAAAFRARLLEGIFEGAAEIPQYRLTEEDWQAIHKLAEERYRSWDWNFGSSPDFNVHKVQRIPGGEIEARIDVQHGRIQALKINGDFFEQNDIADIERRLIDVRYDATSLAAAVKGLDIPRYFSGFSTQEFLNFIYGSQNAE